MRRCGVANAMARRRGFLIHAGAFAAANPLIFALQRRRGRFRGRGAAIQLTSWGAGLAFHYFRAIHQPARRAQKAA